MDSIRKIEVALQTSLDTGVSATAVDESRRRFGSNGLTPLPRTSLWRKFLAKFNEPIIRILLAAAFLSIIVSLVTHHAPWDGIAILGAVGLATGVAFLSEYKSDREFELLSAHKEAIRVKVRREATVRNIGIDEVVVGDVVLLEAGDEIPADGRVARTVDLSVDQSLMTGESEPADKSAVALDEAAEGPEQPGCLYRGTQVIQGTAEMVAAAVGDATYLGQIARQLSLPEGESQAPAARVRRKLSVSKELTPLQEKLERLAGWISKIGYGAAIAIFVALVVRGLTRGDVRWPASGADGTAVLLDSAHALLGYFMYMVVIIVVAVPEGLPMSVTVSLALAMRKMTRSNSLVRQLVACETIGSATVICTDKTGTLTQNRMKVVEAGPWGVGHGAWAVDSADAPSLPPTPHGPRSTVHGVPDWLAINGAVNSTAHLEVKGDSVAPVGNTTEAAILTWLQEHDVDYRRLRLEYPPVCQLHFTSERKHMATVIQHGGRSIMLVKGAPEWVLERCNRWQTNDGDVRSMDEQTRSEVRRRLGECARQAMRTLAFAYEILPEGAVVEETLGKTQRTDMIFSGFVGIRDPLRDDVKEAMDSCRRAGIDVKIVTGDNTEIARAIGDEIRLLDRPDAVVLTSQEFNDLSDEQLSAQLDRLRILARARPLDKLRLVRLLQAQNEVVAVTGDGTNDAPALKKADVGLAMGRAGTEVAKEASKIVLLDDAFSTIVKAVHWGRALYENIQRFVQFQLTINLSALVIAFLGPFFGVKPPFTILQLLWINVIMDTFASIALCSEPPRAGLMALPPRRRDENILTRAMIRNIIATAAFLVVVMMVLLVGMEGTAGGRRGWFAGSGDRSEEFPELTTRQVTIFFTLYVMFQVWNEINCRSLVPEVSGLRGVLRNPVFLAIVSMTVAVQAIIVTFGADVFKVEPLALVDWVWIVVGSSSVLLFGEVMRWMTRS